MTDEEAARRGEEARQLLEHPLLAEAFQTIRNEVIEKWQSSPARDVEGREELWKTLRTVNKLEGQLQSVVETGKVARATLLQRAKQAATSMMSW